MKTNNYIKYSFVIKSFYIYIIGQLFSYCVSRNLRVSNKNCKGFVNQNCNTTTTTKLFSVIC